MSIPRVIHVTVLAILVPLGVAPAAAEAPDCAAIAAATTAELRAGATSWGEAEEALARRAAGAACVKAQARGALPPGAAAAPVAAPGPDTADSANTKSAEASGDDAGGWPAGFTRKKISGSPSKKPYQRKRD